MNPKTAASIFILLIGGVAKVASRIRNRGEKKENSESDSASKNEDAHSPSETDTQQFESEKEKESWEAHKQATNRTPPVDIGETHKLGVEEIIPHHSGTQTARGKVEGFQIFVNDIPSTVRPLDTIRVKITSYGRNRTSAEASFLEYV